MKSYNQILLSAFGCLAALPVYAMGGDNLHSSVMLDRFEVHNSAAGNSSYWEGQAWLGGDLNKAWFKTQGDVSQGRTQDAEAQLLYSRAVAPFWDVQAGVRHDFALNGMPTRNWLALAYKGLAPYQFDVDASVYLGSQGAAARLKSGYSLLLTQRLALIPEIEANLYSKNDTERAIGSGLSNLDLTLRLRYEIRREFAPYLGVMCSEKFGNTANYARLNGERASNTFVTAGLSLWW